MGKGAETRERILELAEAAVLQKGFAGTSIDELIAAAGLTKGGFFYHFKDKSELAKQMLVRYLKRDDEIFTDLIARADELSDDPLHSLMIFVKLLAETLEDLESGHPGCLTASYCYQDQQFNEEIRQLNAAGLLTWRRIFRERIDRIVEKYPPDEDLDLDALADLMTSLIEGGIILSKVLGDTHLLPRQVLLYRDFLKRTFQP